MDTHQLEADDVLMLEGDVPRTLRDLLLDMLVLSDNDAFNTLQETVGFADTFQAMRSWGLTHGIIRRHFTRPHWNHSRPIRVVRRGEVVCNLPARPPVDLPLNSRPPPRAAGQPGSQLFHHGRLPPRRRCHTHGPGP
ncbi:MAG: serine hydrolase [Nitrospiraceae bacterium]|nr:serine hydrolase [Nitrospiraceae bacterium]